LQNYLVKNKHNQLLNKIGNGVNKMIKKLIRTIMLAQAASAASKTLRYLSDRDLEDMGLSRSTFVDGVVESVRADIDEKVADQPMSLLIKSVINPSLVAAV
tara:strand:- start:2453 stop:2755 length:303 start_codon:yes stop_codon:yes gene_type:complete